MTEIKRTKNLYKVLQRDEEITFYASEKINNNLIKKAKKSSYPKDKVFFELFKEVKDVNFEENDKPIIPTYLPFMEKKKDINRSTLYSIISPFGLLHAELQICVF